MTIYEQYNIRTIQAAKQNAYDSLKMKIHPSLVYQTMKRLLPMATGDELHKLISESIYERGGVSGYLW